MDAITVYTKAIELARATSQVVGEKRNYYVTLEQLEYLLMDTTIQNNTDEEAV